MVCRADIGGPRRRHSARACVLADMKCWCILLAALCPARGQESWSDGGETHGDSISDCRNVCLAGAGAGWGGRGGVCPEKETALAEDSSWAGGAPSPFEYTPDHEQQEYGSYDYPSGRRRRAYGYHTVHVDASCAVRCSGLCDQSQFVVPGESSAGQGVTCVPNVCDAADAGASPISATTYVAISLGVVMLVAVAGLAFAFAKGLGPFAGKSKGGESLYDQSQNPLAGGPSPMGMQAAHGQQPVAVADGSYTAPVVEPAAPTLGRKFCDECGSVIIGTFCSNCGKQS